MKKALGLLLIALAVTFVFSQAQAQGTNLLFNPDFENGLSDWDDLYGYPSDVSDIFHTGVYSVTKEVHNDDLSKQDYWSQVYQDVDLLEGEPVFASMYIKTTFAPNATACAGIMIEFLDDDDNNLGVTVNSKVVGGQTDWTLVSASAASAPTGTTKVRLSGILWAKKADTASLTGSVYYDDAFLEKRYQPPVLPTQLSNPGFENGMLGWENQYGFPAELTSGFAHTGTYSALKTLQEIPDHPGQDYYSKTYQDIGCAAGKQVTGVIFIKTAFSQRNKAKAGLLIEYYDGNDNLIKKYKKEIGGVNDWRRVIVSVKKAPPRTVKIRFSAYVWRFASDRNAIGKAAYFDDASLLIK